MLPAYTGISWQGRAGVALLFRGTIPRNTRDVGTRPPDPLESLAAVVARGQPLVDLLAGGADRIAFRVPAGYPHLAAQRDQRRAHHRTLDDLVLLHVVREPLVIAVAVRQVGPDVLVDARLLLGKNLSLTHVGESSRRRARERGGKSSRIESLGARRLVKARVVGVRRHVGELAALAA